MIEKLEYYSSGSTSRDGLYVLWERHPNQEDIVEKINEIIDYINNADEERGRQ